MNNLTRKPGYLEHSVHRMLEDSMDREYASNFIGDQEIDISTNFRQLGDALKSNKVRKSGRFDGLEVSFRGASKQLGRTPANTGEFVVADIFEKGETESGDPLFEEVIYNRKFGECVRAKPFETKQDLRYAVELAEGLSNAVEEPVSVGTDYFGVQDTYNAGLPGGFEGSEVEVISSEELMQEVEELEYFLENPEELDISVKSGHRTGMIEFETELGDSISSYAEHRYGLERDTGFTELVLSGMEKNDRFDYLSDTVQEQTERKFSYTDRWGNLMADQVEGTREKVIDKTYGEIDFAPEELIDGIYQDINEHEENPQESSNLADELESNSSTSYA